MLGRRARGDTALMLVIESGEAMTRHTVVIVVTATSKVPRWKPSPSGDGGCHGSGLLVKGGRVQAAIVSNPTPEGGGLSREGPCLPDSGFLRWVQVPDRRPDASSVRTSRRAGRRHDAGSSRNGFARNAGIQHCRGERVGSSGCRRPCTVSDKPRANSVTSPLRDILLIRYSPRLVARRPGSSFFQGLTRLPPTPEGVWASAARRFCEDHLTAKILGADRVIAPNSEGVIQQAGGHAGPPHLSSRCSQLEMGPACPPSG